MTYGVHKDRKPEETIKVVLSAVKKLGIDLAEAYWNSFNQSHYSVAVYDRGVGMVATNGKGVTKPYAMASACAEFMERLQNGCLYRWSFGLKNEIRFQYPDERSLTVAQCIENGKDLGLTRRFLNDLRGQDKRIESLPFYNCFEGTVHYFPTRVLYKGFSNTGMCAGNTPEEALVQGICEIFERYVSQLMFENEELVFPTIAADKIQSPQITKLLGAYTKAGMHILIKDLTLGGRFPVLAVILLDRSRTRMRVSAGSFVTAEIALERCLTELSQGLNANTIQNYMTDIDLSEREYATIHYASDVEQRIYEQGRWREDKSGRYPNRILKSGGGKDGDFRKAFLKDYNNSGQALKFVLEILQNQGLKLYTRDVSFLDFPTYFLYCPSLSERFGWRHWVRNAQRQQKVKNVLLRLNSAGNSKLDQVAAFFESQTKSPYVSNTNFPLLMDIHTKPAGLITFPRFIIWAMIYNRCKAYEKALTCLNLNMKFGDYRSFYASAKVGMPEVLMQGVPLPVQIYWLTFYFKMKTEKCPEGDIRSTLTDIYGKDMYQAMHDIVTRTDKLWGDFDFPICGECGPCPISKICDYDRWKSVIERLNSKMQRNFPQQADLARLFNGR